LNFAHFLRLSTVAAFAMLPAIAVAQQPHVFVFNPDPRFPVEIESDTLSVDDADKTATFENSMVRQDGADLHMRCAKLVVWYGPAPGSSDQQNISLLDCQQ
jgi:lipopolysaccharide export system protein LptA